MLATWRAAWRCDCDGSSHKGGTYSTSGAHKAVEAMASHMEAVTGARPPTCPWRVFYDPLVREAIRVSTMASERLGDAALGADPPALLVDAVYEYLRARNATKSHDWKQREKQREAERRRQQKR